MSQAVMALLVAVGIYWLGLLAIGVRSFQLIDASRLDDYYLAGRRLGYVLLPLSLLATINSAWLLLGNTGLAYSGGLTYMVYLTSILTLAIPMATLYPRIWLIGRRYKYVTPAEMVGDCYSSSLLRAAVGLLAVLMGIPYIALQLTAAGLIFETLTKGAIPYGIGVVALAAVVVIYVFLGGMKSIAITDAIQGVLLASVALMVPILLVVRLGGVSIFVDGITNDLGARFLAFTEDSFFSFHSVWSLTLAVAFGFSLAPVFVTWAMTARTPKVHRFTAFWMWGIVSGAIYIIAVPITGLAGRLVMGEMESGDTLVPTVLGAAPTVIAVIGGVGIIAAMQSTADAYMMNTSSMVVRDFYLPFINPRASTSVQLWLTRAVVLVMVMLSLLMSMLVEDVLVLLGALGVAIGGQLAPTMLGVTVWKLPTRQGLLTGMAAGVTTVILFYFVWRDPLGIHHGLWGVAANFLLVVVISALTRGRSRSKVAEYHNEIESALQYGERIRASTGR